jgi:hypothetical protein
MTSFWSFFDHFEHWLPVRSLLPMTSQLVGSGCTHNLLFVSDMGIWAIIEGERWDLRSYMIKVSSFYQLSLLRLSGTMPSFIDLALGIRYLLYRKLLSHALQIRYSGSVTHIFSKLLVFGNYEWQSALSWFSHNSTTLEYSLVIFAITVVSTWVIPESLLSVIIKWFSKLLWIIIYVSNVFTSISLNHQTSGFLNRARYLEFSVFSDIIP